ncbi:MAG TPA: MOSC domain-containing protein, partial [Cyclobacteriaceae bacterium]|nr:MOSC domain-containing protein [Cyclobacteriaceae bacterium]
MKIISLTEIWIYPIKSLGGILLNEAAVMPKGLAYDRRWMLADDNGVFLTQRKYPEMALFKLMMGEDNLQVRFQADVLDIPLHPEVSEKQRASIWDDEVIVLKMGKQYDQWFSERLGINCQLLYFPEANERKVDQAYASPGDNVSLADGYPFLIIGQSSLDDLNQRLEIPVPMNRFRPNFVFTGADAFAEDTWKEIRIGEIEFKLVKPCARCVLTTVNQETAEKGEEPLRTLTTFRKQNGKVMFGQNMLAA